MTRVENGIVLKTWAQISHRPLLAWCLQEARYLI